MVWLEFEMKHKDFKSKTALDVADRSQWPLMIQSACAKQSFLFISARNVSYSGTAYGYDAKFSRRLYTIDIPSRGGITRWVYFGSVRPYVAINQQVFALATVYKTRLSAANNLPTTLNSDRTNTCLLPISFIDLLVGAMSNRENGKTYFFWAVMTQFLTYRINHALPSVYIKRSILYLNV
ncbi:hypothetical protein [Absidia glauca]|uniref:Uncharacterized protein n=1 Tax=Absidia glauca TaxID=4829 RepID=A0A163JCX7_ABSGL|nr:hypothetical protein [Absidia glauca]